jgi:hypothetical protein
MTIKRFRPLITGGIVVIVLLVLRLVLPSVLPAVAGEIASFLTVFLAILMAFIFLIAFTASELGGKISRRPYQLIERIIIAGILLGVVGMFQPWTMLGYRIGFHLLLASTLAFTLWSHVSPRVTLRDKGPSVQEYAEE